MAGYSRCRSVSPGRSSPTSVPAAARRRAQRDRPAVQPLDMQWRSQRLAHGLVGLLDAPSSIPTRGRVRLLSPIPSRSRESSRPGSTCWSRRTWRSMGSLLLATLVLNGRRDGPRRSPGCGAGRLARRGVGSLDAVRVPRVGVLQLVMVFPFFLRFGRAPRSGTEPTPARECGSGSGRGHVPDLGVLRTVPAAVLAVGDPDHVRRRLGRREVIGPLLIGLGSAALLSAPMLVPQAHFTARSAGPPRRSPRTAWLSRTTGVSTRTARIVVRFWLGATPASTSARAARGPRVVGFAVAWAAGRRRWAVFLGVGALATGAVSLGLHLELGGFAPTRCSVTSPASRASGAPSASPSSRSS